MKNLSCVFKKSPFLFIAVIACFAAIPIHSAPAPAGRVLAVLPINGGSASKAVITPQEGQQLVETVRGIARRSLSRTEGWQVMSREAVEAKISNADVFNCNGEEACVVAAGRKIQTDYIVSGDIGRVGSYLEISVSLFDVASGQLIGSEWPRGKTIDDIIDALESTPDKLFANLPGHAIGKSSGVQPQPDENPNDPGQTSMAQSKPDTQVIMEDQTYYGDPVIVDPYYYGSPYYYWDGSAWIYWGGHGYYHGSHGYHGGFRGGHGGGFHGHGHR